MDQVKIGKFISTQRKKQNLTQTELAEKLNITDRAVSKWETGRSLPDASIMLELCDILKISVNDLLNGEIIVMNEHNENQNKIVLDLLNQKQISDKRLLKAEWYILSLLLLILFSSLSIGILIDMTEWIRWIIIFSGFIIFILGCLICLKIEQIVGFYKCAKCGHKFVPTFHQVNMACHIGRKRYMKCPECKQRSWCKKEI